jgi:hypothetical protein
MVTTTRILQLKEKGMKNEVVKVRYPVGMKTPESRKYALLMV